LDQKSSQQNQTTSEKVDNNPKQTTEIQEKIQKNNKNSANSSEHKVNIKVDMYHYLIFKIRPAIDSVST
jgi:hypothetical protein